MLLVCKHGVALERSESAVTIGHTAEEAVANWNRNWAMPEQGFDVYEVVGPPQHLFPRVSITLVRPLEVG